MIGTTRAVIIDRTRRWVRENFLYMRPDWPLPDDAPLLRGGVIDSVGIIELVAWLEHDFQLDIPERDITELHFGTLGGIAEYLVGRAQPPQAGNATYPRYVA